MWSPVVRSYYYYNFAELLVFHHSLGHIFYCNCMYWYSCGLRWYGVIIILLHFWWFSTHSFIDFTVTVIVLSVLLWSLDVRRIFVLLIILATSILINEDETVRGFHNMLHCLRIATSHVNIKLNLISHGYTQELCLVLFHKLR